MTYIDIGSDPLLDWLIEQAGAMEAALSALGLHEVYGPTWESSTGVFCFFFEAICDDSWRYKATPWVDQYQMYVAEARDQMSPISVK